jgi:hypothetical protein
LNLTGPHLQFLPPTTSRCRESGTDRNGNTANYLTNFPYTETSMRRLASIFAIFILLLTAAPLLACMTDSVMSQEESACCRAMHGKCDGMEKMGCCRTQLRTDEHPQTAASAPIIDLHLAVVDWLEPFVSEVQNVPPSIPGMADAHSPPGLVIAKITVLRI